MCLVPFKKEIKIAEEDIICYKVAYTDSFMGGKYYSLFRSNPIKLGTLETSTDKRWDREWKRRIPERVEKGGFHSYARRSDAVICANRWENALVIKCVIPKGTEYLEGLFGTSRSYVSREIKYVEVVL